MTWFSVYNMLCKCVRFNFYVFLNHFYRLSLITGCELRIWMKLKVFLYLPLLQMGKFPMHLKCIMEWNRLDVLFKTRLFFASLFVSCFLLLLLIIINPLLIFNFCQTYGARFYTVARAYIIKIRNFLLKG